MDKFDQHDDKDMTGVTSAADTADRADSADSADLSSAVAGINVAAEADAFIKQFTQVLESVSKISSALEKGQEPANLSLFVKIIKPMWVSAENSLPQIREAQDVLEMTGDEDKAAQLSRLALQLEDSLDIIRLKLEEFEKKLKAQEAEQGSEAAAKTEAEEPSADASAVVTSDKAQ